jgi:uncharacterized protein (TIGR00297 family)
MKTRAMSVSGGIGALVLFAAVGFFGKSWAPILFITILFLLSTAVSVIGKKIKTRTAGQKEHGKPRTVKQIVAVGLLAFAALVLHVASGKTVFYYVFFLALTEQIADSMASDIGSLTKRKNVSILTFHPVEKGISGGVSVLGTSAALISSFALSALPMAFGAYSLRVFIVIGSAAFLGTVIDSIVGALMQSLYECRACGRLVEEPIHCDTSATLVKGLRVIDNVAVNHIAGVITCGIGFLMLLI